MDELLRAFFGTVDIELAGLYPERTVNICAVNGVALRHVTWGARGVSVAVSPREYRKLLEISERTGVFSVNVRKKRGFAYFLRGMRARRLLISGFAACMILLLTSSMFIWQIEVSGNEEVSAVRILDELKRLGVDIGANRFTVSQEYISNEMLRRIPELCWITVNTKGSRLDVLVREAYAPPDIPDRNVPADVTAAKNGVVREIVVFSGRKAVAAGDAVSEDDVLIEGTLDSLGRGAYSVRSEGIVEADVEYVLSASIPLKTRTKAYTGRHTTRTSMILLGKRINLYLHSGNRWTYYDKIISNKLLTAPDGSALPLTVVRERTEEYVPSEKVLSAEAAERLLRSRLTARLFEESAGAVISADFERETEDGVMTVTLRAVCREDIGRTITAGAD